MFCKTESKLNQKPVSKFLDDGIQRFGDMRLNKLATSIQMFWRQAST